MLSKSMPVSRERSDWTGGENSRRGVVHDYMHTDMGLRQQVLGFHLKSKRCECPSQGQGGNLAFMEALNWLASYSSGINVLTKDFLFLEKIYVSAISSRSCLCSQSTSPVRYSHHYFVFITVLNLLRKQD